tara:strand:- start:30329 stop:31084 length:756 start_codon:yes stop_codon:yes gene_type:complete
MSSLLLFVFSCKSNKAKSLQADEDIVIVQRQIEVDGKSSDWSHIPSVYVGHKNNLWIGEGVPAGEWEGKKDLSYSWKSAWNKNKIYFLFEVKDDTLSNFDQSYAWMNDCIEIYIDPNRKGGQRIAGIGSENSLEDRIGKNMRGFEMQFLPSNPPKVFMDDSKSVYFTHQDQNSAFKEVWQGNIVVSHTSDGYTMEIGFSLPDESFKPDYKMGMDVAICDDDGKGRKNLMIWSGYKGEFWLTMDNFKGMILK